MTDPWPNLAPSPAAYLAAARELPPGGHRELALRPLRVAVLTTYTASWLPPYLRIEAARRGLDVQPWIGPYQQLEQPVLGADSELWRHRPEVIVIASRLEDWSPEVPQRLARAGAEEVERLVGEAVTRVGRLLAAIRERSPAHILALDWVRPPVLAGGIGGPTGETAPDTVWRRANARLAERCQEQSDVWVVELAQLAAHFGLGSWHDPRLDYLARIPYAQPAQLAIGRHLARVLRCLVAPARKCLALDLDGTLWGGVLGEDGVGGIALGDDYPGRAFRDFQHTAARLRERGVLLALVSKNNLEEVQAAFASHRDMVLAWDDFAAHEVHWGDKAQSLVAIAHRLNLGLDALAFVDDSPLERGWVAERLPAVAVLDLPADPWQRPAALADWEVFDQLHVSAEDRQRAQMYAEERQRAELAKHTSVDEFLAGLELRVEVGSLDQSTLPRVAQLVGKTNQFNLTTRRYGEAELAGLQAAGGEACWLRARDRFGDYGLVGFALALPADGTTWRLDSFLLSCRILGRAVDSALLAVVAGRVAARGGTVLLGEYVASGRNGVAADVFERHGFVPQDADRRWWQRELVANPLTAPAFIQVRHQEPVHGR